MTAVVAVVNQKGGVGKTAATVNLAASAAAAGARVLVVDADPQASASRALDPAQPPFSLNDVLEAGYEGAAADAVVPAGAPEWGAVQLIPAELCLARRDVDQTIGAEQRLRRSLVGVRDQFDLTLIDCPPSVNRLVAGALVAADVVLLVTEPGRDSIAGLASVQETIALVREAYNPRLGVVGVLLNRVEGRTGEHARRVGELAHLYGALLWQPYVPKRAALAESQGAARPVRGWPGGGARDAAVALDELAHRLLATVAVPLPIAVGG